jgi:hypothetical protein
MNGLTNANRMEIRTEPLPLTSTPTPPTREGAEGGKNVTKSLRNEVKLIEHAESTTQNHDLVQGKTRTY